MADADNYPEVYAAEYAEAGGHMDNVLTYLRSSAAALRLQASGYAANSTSKVRAGLIAHADAIDVYADAIEAAPPSAGGGAVFLLLL